MAVHVPLSNEAQIETKLMMLAPNNIFSPANGKPITTPTQDITLGAYYLTAKPVKKGEHPKMFTDYFEVLFALDSKVIKIHEEIKLPNPNLGKKTLWGDAEPKHLTTTAGRCIFNEIWTDPRLGFFNGVANKKALTRLVSDAYLVLGHEGAVRILDKLKTLGYEYATRAGFSISITDLTVPDKKQSDIDVARKEVKTIESQCAKVSSPMVSARTR